MNTGFVTLKELAGELGVDRSGLRRSVLKHDIATFKIIVSGTRGQPTLAITDEDAEYMREVRRDGYIVGDVPQAADQTAPPNEHGGYFYIVQLIPDHLPRRVKLGYALDPNKRLLGHQTAAPTARIVKTWPCPRTWETAAIASITKEGCTQIGTEVFDCDDLDALVTSADEFFALMP